MDDLYNCRAGQEEAHKLLFYASVNGNGDFYFDDINFYIEDAPGKWRQLERYTILLLR